MHTPHALSAAFLASALFLLPCTAAHAAYFDSTYSQKMPAATTNPATSSPAAKAAKTTGGYIRIPSEGVEIRDPWMVKSPLTGPTITAIPGSTPTTWTYIKHWIKGRLELPSLNPANRPDYPRTAAVVQRSVPNH